VRAKTLLRHIWQEGHDWYTPLPAHADITRRWQTLVRDINSVLQVSFDRHFFKNSTTDPSLHIFVDASKVAYGAAAYLCNDQQSTLVMAKTRVAPIKAVYLEVVTNLSTETF